MQIHIMTLFPQTVSAVLGESIIGRAQKNGLVQISCHQIRDYTENKQMQVDDYPYGGGLGMVMQAQPLHKCWQDICRGEHVHTILMSPAGKTFTQKDARRLRDLGRFILVCGHYEGVDQRFIDACVDEELSIGDFVLTGGEIPAMAIADAVCRLVPGVLADTEAFTEESHWAGTLEYPQYSRPELWEGRPVPPVLLTGHHANIQHWRRKEALKRTLLRRPDMFRKLTFSKQDRKILAELKAELGEDAPALLRNFYTGRLTMKKSGEKELKGLRKLRRQIQGLELDEAALRQELEDFAQRPDACHFSIYTEDHGFCGECWYRGETRYIALLPHARRVGIAAYCLGQLEEKAVNGALGGNNGN